MFLTVLGLLSIPRLSQFLHTAGILSPLLLFKPVQTLNIIFFRFVRHVSCQKKGGLGTNLLFTIIQTQQYCLGNGRQRTKLKLTYLTKNFTPYSKFYSTNIFWSFRDIMLHELQVYVGLNIFARSSQSLLVQNFEVDLA